MEDHDAGVPFVFAMPADWMGPLVGERDDDDTSLSDASGNRQEGQQHRSARQDFPAVLGGDVSRGRCNRGVTHSGPTSPGLAPERDRLRQGGLSDSVIQSIQAARAGSTTACYRPKWLGFQRWCEERKIEPLSCELGSIL